MIKQLFIVSTIFLIFFQKNSIYGGNRDTPLSSTLISNKNNTPNERLIDNYNNLLKSPENKVYQLKFIKEFPTDLTKIENKLGITLEDYLNTLSQLSAGYPRKVNSILYSFSKSPSRSYYTIDLLRNLLFKNQKSLSEYKKLPLKDRIEVIKLYIPEVENKILGKPGSSIQGLINRMKYWGEKKIATEIESISLAYIPYFIQTGGLYRSKQPFFKSHNFSFAFGKVPFVYTAQSSIMHPSYKYSPQKAVDNNTNTAWCSNKKKTTVNLIIQLKPYAGHLIGIGLINGYTKSHHVWKNNGKLKSGTVKFGNSKAKKFYFKETSFKNGFIPYQAIHYLDLYKTPVTKLLKENYRYKKTPLKLMDVEIKILETYPGDKDVCISEIYPVYKHPPG